MKLSRTLTYAVQAMLLLNEADSSRPCTCRQLAHAGAMPERFLLQVLRSLVTGGILQSSRGIRGGYRLARQAEDITLREIIEAVEGRIAFDAPSELGMPERLRETIEQVAEFMRRKLDQITLAMMAALPSEAYVEAGADSRATVRIARLGTASAQPVVNAHAEQCEDDSAAALHHDGSRSSTATTGRGPRATPATDAKYLIDAPTR